MKKTLRILILEDMPSDAKLMEFELLEAGIDFISKLVMTEKDFVRGLESFSPDIILSDYDLPQYNGMLALAEAGKRCPDVPFILVTGMISEERAIDILTSGAKDYVMKNRLNRLVPAVRRALEEAEEQRARKKAEAELLEAHRTLEKQVEERTRELQESRERLSLALASSGMGIFEWDITENKRHWDDNLHLLMGKRQENFALTAEAFFEIVHPEDRKAVQEALKKAIEQGSAYENEYRVVWPDGSVHDISVRGKVHRDDSGRPIRIIGVCWDVTGRKRDEEAIRLNEARLESLLRINQQPTDNIQELLDFALNEAIILTGSDIGYIYFYNEEKKEFVLNTWSGEVMRQCTITEPQTLYHLEKTGIWGEAVRQGRPIVVNDFTAPNPLKMGMPPGHAPLHKFLTIPVFSEGSIVAVVGVANKHDDYNDSDIRQLNLMMDAVWKIVQRKQAEETLRKSEATLRSLFKATPVGLCIMKNRVYQSANKAWYDSFGYSESDIIGHTTRMLYEDEEEYDRVGRELYTGLSERGLASLKTRLRRKDGVLRDVTLIAAPLQSGDLSLGTIVAIQDVTDYRQAVEELSESRRQLADIIEFLPDATFVIDKDSNVIAWNRAMEAMSGIGKEDMLGRGDYEYALPFYGERRPVIIDLALHPDLEVEKQYTTVKRAGDILFGESYTPNLPPGDVHLSATASVLRCSRGEIIAAIECIRDNTERKRMEERLSRAEKMEGLGRLAGGVAHDLNNVLGILVGYSELLRDKLPEDSPMRRYAENILQSGVRGAAIIQDLLTLARRGVNVSEVVDLNRVVPDYLKTPEFENLRLHHPQVKIRAELEEGLLNIKGSPVHLGKTIMNLVSNAVEAISGRGEVTIKTENRYLDQPLQGYDEMEEGDYAVLTVTDTGSGISANDLGKIFEPFYTKKVMGRSGTGLGLAVVWGTVKDHHGYIDVVSEEGRGSTFTLYFPVTREAPAQAGKAASPVSYMGKGESILVVDDVKEQRELAASMLERLGYRVDAAAGGEAAVAYIQNQKVDLVVLDMIMDPGMDGMDTYRGIIEINPGQKAIIVSGFSETGRVRQAQKMGAGAFVRKPYILEKIGLAVRKELDRQRSP
jgi:two-component system, cell cycle sensor histidine kinase and response regulator CckA